MSARIETADELDALPEDTYWVCGCRYHGAKIGQDAYRLTTGRALSRQEVVDGHLPITVLWTPDAPRSSDAVRALRSVAQAYRTAIETLKTATRIARGES